MIRQSLVSVQIIKLLSSPAVTLASTFEGIVNNRFRKQLHHALPVALSEGIAAGVAAAFGATAIVAANVRTTRIATHPHVAAGIALPVAHWPTGVAGGLIHAATDLLKVMGRRVV